MPCHVLLFAEHLFKLISLTNPRLKMLLAVMIPIILLASFFREVEIVLNHSLQIKMLNLFQFEDGGE
jgi:hypothetical protein